MNKGKVTNAAILLFGKEPQKFFLTSEVKCAHYHGMTVEKPIPFYQVYKGNLFELTDQAVNFVLSKINHLTDSIFANEMDVHLHYGAGDFPLVEFLKLIPQGAKVTNEAKHNSEDHLDDFWEDVCVIGSFYT